jgi:hypothetical protein
VGICECPISSIVIPAANSFSLGAAETNSITLRQEFPKTIDRLNRATLGLKLLLQA